MGGFASSIQSVVAPQAGPVVAGACVRAAASNAGRASAEDLSWADWPAVESAVRAFLSPIAPSSTIDSLLGRIKEDTVV